MRILLLLLVVATQLPVSSRALPNRIVTSLVLDAVDEAQGRQLMRATDSLCALLRLPFFGEVRLPGVRPLLLALGPRHTCARSVACNCCRTFTCLKYA